MQGQGDLLDGLLEEAGETIREPESSDLVTKGTRARKKKKRTKAKRECEWWTLFESLTKFVNHEKHQDQAHIHQLQSYVACRLVLEGGFHPNDIWPRPPFKVHPENGRLPLLSYVSGSGIFEERVVQGGVKSKRVDVTVVKNGATPLLAVSLKGMRGALRNMSNRMEELIGETANLHMSYPALVFGYLMVLRANREGEGIPDNNVAIRLARKKMEAGYVARPVKAIYDFSHALGKISGRKTVDEPVHLYEATSVILAETGEHTGAMFEGFKGNANVYEFDKFFSTLYKRYDERHGRSGMKRQVWSRKSPILADRRFQNLGFTISTAEDEDKL